MPTADGRSDTQPNNHDIPVPPWIGRAEAWIGSWPRWKIVVVASCGVAAVAGIDLVTGQELSLSVFFLLPVGYSAWFAGRNPAFGIAFASATLWYLADRLGGTVYSLPHQRRRLTHVPGQESRQRHIHPRLALSRPAGF